MPQLSDPTLVLIIPTLLGIMLINFIIIQAAPGGRLSRRQPTYMG